MENRIHDISQRIKELRDILGIDAEEMARCTELPVDKYLELESGNSDFTFTFIYKCAKRFGVQGQAVRALLGLRQVQCRG